MKNNKLLIILSTILIVFICVIVFLLINIDRKSTFKKPEFDKSAEEIPSNLNYEESVLKVVDGYSIYISSSPKFEDNHLKIDFISLGTNNIWIKVRILDENNKIIGETGLVKPGEYLEKVKLNKSLKSKDQIKYKIMGYEIDSYLSAGVIKLNTKVG